MQPQEFNAFVAAIVSARTANLMAPARAQELIESAANAAGFGPKERAENCRAIAESNGRRISIGEAFKDRLLKDGSKVLVEFTVIDLEDDDYDGSLPVELRSALFDADWVHESTEVIIPNA